MAYATVDQLAAALRIRVTPENTDTLQACLDAAAAEIDADLDRLDPLPSPAGSPTPLFSALWQFSTSTVMADPGVRHLRISTAITPFLAAGANQLAVSTTDDDSVDRRAQLIALQVGDRIAIRSTTTAGDWVTFQVTAAPVNLTTWVRLDVVTVTTGELVSSPGNNDRLLLDMVRPTGGTPGTVPAEVVRVNVNRAVEWVKAPDAPGGVMGFDQIGIAHAPKDGFARHAVTIRHLKQQWGVG